MIEYFTDVKLLSSREIAIEWRTEKLFLRMTIMKHMKKFPINPLPIISSATLQLIIGREPPEPR